MQLGQERFSDINHLFAEKLSEKKSLIAVHRGSWGGNITQNTIGAYKCAISMGADMVEADVNSTTDGVLYSFHDGNEMRVFGVDKCIKQMSSAEVDSYHPINTCNQPTKAGINRLSEVLEFLPEGVLLNIDRAWDIFPQLLSELDKYPKARYQVLLKAPVKAIDALEALNCHAVKYMFMPICYSMEDVEKVLSYTDINTVGAEIIAFDADSVMFEDSTVEYLHNHHLFAWVNAITLGDVITKPLFAGLDDDISVLENPDLGWGKLFEKHIDVLQTDWPAILRDYRKQKLGT